MDSLNPEKQLEYAGQLMRDEARSENPKRCVAAISAAYEILNAAQMNLTMPKNVRLGLRISLCGLSQIFLILRGEAS